MNAGKEEHMTPITLFIVTLIAGIFCIKISKNRKGKKKGTLRFIGLILCAFSVFGLFTAFL